MRIIAVSVIVISMAFSWGVCGLESAGFGSAFADVFESFAPLSVLHRSYADYLFYGTDVTIPGNLEVSCEHTGYLLATLHIDLLTQTASKGVSVMPRLARLRADLAAFCDGYSQILAAIAALESSDLPMLKEASELGVFSDIYRLQGELQSVFEAYLSGLSDEQDIWRFGVAFSLRTLLSQDPLERIDPGLRAILYGSEGAENLPAFVPSDIASIIEQLELFIDVALDAANEDNVRYLAQMIYDAAFE